jgi:DNA-binding response OmpR family regulator
MAITPEAVDPPAVGVTPWVLVLIDDDQRRAAVRLVCEEAGFAVEIAASAQDALDCLKVMTPSLVVIEDRLYKPVPH